MDHASTTLLFMKIILGLEKQHYIATGLGLKYGCPLGVNYSQAFVKAISGRQAGLEDLKEDEPQAFKLYQGFQTASPQAVRDYCLTFDPIWCDDLSAKCYSK